MSRVSSIYRATQRAASRIAVAAFITATTPIVAFAAGTGGTMPWDTPLQNIEQDLTGTVAKLVGIIAVAGFGLMFAFGEHGSAVRKGGGIVFGLSIAFSAATFAATFLGYTGGAAFPLAHAAHAAVHTVTH